MQVCFSRFSDNCLLIMHQFFKELLKIIEKKKSFLLEKKGCYSGYDLVQSSAVNLLLIRKLPLCC